MSHTPVLLREVIDHLHPQSGETVIDLTVGLGGHAKAFSEKIGSKGKLIGLDADEKNLAEATKNIAEKNVQFLHVNFRELRYGLLPVGELLIRLTEASGDVHTQEGLSKASAMLSQRGMVVLDAHLAPFDIIATSIALSEGLKVRSCVAPVSAYDYYFPIIRRGFFSRLGKINGVELFPVYRDQDLEHWKNKPFQPPKQDWRQRREAVLSYYRRSLSAVAEPGSLVVVAAYNGVNRLREGSGHGGVLHF